MATFTRAPGGPQLPSLTLCIHLVSLSFKRGMLRSLSHAVLKVFLLHLLPIFPGFLLYPAWSIMDQGFQNKQSFKPLSSGRNEFQAPGRADCMTWSSLHLYTKSSLPVALAHDTHDYLTGQHGRSVLWPRPQRYVLKKISHWIVTHIGVRPHLGPHSLLRFILIRK